MTAKDTVFFFQYARVHPIYYHHRNKPESDAYHLISYIPGLQYLTT
jgi:hypothetical protein